MRDPIRSARARHDREAGPRDARDDDPPSGPATPTDPDPEALTAALEAWAARLDAFDQWVKYGTAHGRRS